MSSSKTNTKLKDKLRKDYLRNSKITTDSISKFQERVLCPDNPNEVSLRRTHIYQKTVYRTSDIDKASVKPSPLKKIESKNLLHKCELIAEIEKQLKHLQSQQKYLQMTKETHQYQSWRESLLANQSSKTKKDLSKQESTEKLPNICDNDTRQVCALLQLLVKKNCVKVADSSTQIEKPIKHKNINGKDFSLSYETQNAHLSSSVTSSVNVVWKGGTNSRMMRRTSLKMVDSSIQVGCPIGGPKHRSTQVSIRIAGSSEQLNNPIRVSKQRLRRKQHPPSSESSKSSATFKGTDREANEFGENLTNQREDYSRKRSKSYYKPLDNKLRPQVKKEKHTRNLKSIESSKSVLVVKSRETRISLTPRTKDMPSWSPKSYAAEIEEMTASPPKTVRSDNRKIYQSSHARSKMFHQNKETPRRENKTTSKYRANQSSFKTNSQQMAPFADIHLPIRNQFSRQTLTISARKHLQNSSIGSQIILSSTRKTIQTRRAGQIANTMSPTQSYKDSKHEHRMKSPNDLSRESHAAPQWNSLSVRSNVIDDMTYIIPDTDRSEDYIVLPYVYNQNVVESPPAKGATNYSQSPDKMSKNVMQKSSVTLEDALSRESYVNTSITSRVLQNEMQFKSNTVGSTQINASIPPGLDQFDQSTRSHYNKMENMLYEQKARTSSNSDDSVRNQSFNFGNTSKNLVLKSASVLTLAQGLEVSDMSRQLSQKNTFQSHPSDLKYESIRSDLRHDSRTNTLKPSRSNRSDTVPDTSVTYQSHQPEIKDMSQEKLQMLKNLELKKTNNMSLQSELSHEHQNNASNRTNSINSDLGKHEDIESDFIHKLQKNTATPRKYESKDDLLRSKTDIFKTVKKKEHLSKSEIYRKVEDTDIIRQNGTKADINIFTLYEQSERSNKSDLELKFNPSLSKSVTSADQSGKMTCSDHSFTLKPIVQSKIDEDVADHCIPPQRGVQKSERDKGIDTLKTEEQVFINSKIDEVNDVRTSSKILAEVPVNPIIVNDKAETNQEHGSITATITEIPSELLNYIQYLQNRLKDCDEMVEKHTHYQEETFQNVEGLKVENPLNSKNSSVEQKTRQSSSLIKTEESIGLDDSLDSVSKFEVSCCCSCCDEEQSTSYHSDIPPFTGCDCMKEGYYQIMRLAYGK